MNSIRWVYFTYTIIELAANIWTTLYIYTTFELHITQTRNATKQFKLEII